VLLETWCYVATGISDNLNVAETISGQTGDTSHPMRFNCRSSSLDSVTVPSIDGIGVWYYESQPTDNEYFDRITCNQFT
jgi:hypothetical protein